VKLVGNTSILTEQ